MSNSRSDDPVTQLIYQSFLELAQEQKLEREAKAEAEAKTSASIQAETNAIATAAEELELKLVLDPAHKYQVENMPKILECFRPNFTLFVTGITRERMHRASRITNSYQHQMLPFVRTLMTKYPNWFFQIIICDPFLPQIPKIAEVLQCVQSDDESNVIFSSKDLSLSVICIRQKLDLNSSDSKLITCLIDRTCNAHMTAKNTYLLAVYDLYDNRWQDNIKRIYSKAEHNYNHNQIFQRNVLIATDISYTELNSPASCPLLIENKFGELEFVNPAYLSPTEISAVLAANLPSSISDRVKLLVESALISRILELRDKHIAEYVQFRLTLTQNEAQLTPLEAQSQLDFYTEVLQKQIKAAFAFLEFFETGLSDKLTKPLLGYLANPAMEPMLLTDVFTSCGCTSRMGGINFELTAGALPYSIRVNPDQYRDQLVHYTISHVKQFDRLPIFQEFLLKGIIDTFDPFMSDNELTAIPYCT